MTFAENSYTHNYQYTNGKPHQISRIQKGTTSNYENFEYDRNGNMKSHEASHDWLYFWDESNRLRSAVKGQVKMWHYIYDAGGERTLKASTNFNKIYENGTPGDGGSTLNNYTTYPSAYMTISPASVYTKHYFAGSQRVASSMMGSASIFNVIGSIGGLQDLKDKQMADIQSVADSLDLGEVVLGEDAIGGPIEPIGNDLITYYFHSDHLGSSTAITDGSGYLYQIFLNLPFGATERKSHAVFLEGCERSSLAEQRRSGTFSTAYKFNGKELDSETGLYYYGARYYNPRTSVWLSVDPIALWQPVQEVEHYIEGQHNDGYFNPKNMSVYGYTYQNPIVYVDPNGKQNIANGLIGGTKKALLNVAEQTFYYAAGFYLKNNNLKEFNFEELEIDKVDVGLEFGKGFAEGVSPVGLFKGLKDIIKVGKIGYNASKDSKVGIFENESENIISILDIFDKKNEKHLKTFINSIVFGTFEEFLIDGLKNDFNQTFDKGTMDKIIKYLTDKSSELIFEAVKEISSEIQDGYSKIKVK